jgi:hypothetical protein
MTIRVTGIKAELARIKKETKALVKEGLTNVGRGINAAVQTGMDRTPVYSGEAVRNYKVGINRVPVRANPPVQGRVPWPPDGPLPSDLQNEARRGANEAAVNSEVAAVVARLSKMRKLPNFIVIKNTSDIADLIENGSAPTAARSRYPGGVTGMMQLSLISNSRGMVR